MGRNKGEREEILETVIYHPMHKSIYRRMHLWLEIDLVRVHWRGYYGTGMEADYEKHRHLHHRSRPGRDIYGT